MNNKLKTILVISLAALLVGSVQISDVQIINGANDTNGTGKIENIHFVKNSSVPVPSPELRLKSLSFNISMTNKSKTFSIPIIFTNGAGKSLVYNVSVTGNTSSWFTVPSSDTNILLQAKSSTEIPLILNIPKNVSVGTYNGTILIRTAENYNATNLMAYGMSVPVSISIYENRANPALDDWIDTWGIPIVASITEVFLLFVFIYFISRNHHEETE